MNLRANNMLRKQRRYGFMLVEALISIVLLATVLGLALTTLGRARRHAALNNDRLEALHLSRQQMEYIRNLSYSQLANSTSKVNNCTYTCVVSPNNYFGVNLNKDVTLTVTCTNAGMDALIQTTTVTLVTSMASALHQ